MEGQNYNSPFFSKDSKEKWKQESGIMLALDVSSREEAFSLLDKVIDHIDVIKFNYPLILVEGLEIITEVKRRYEKPILADLKVADVPVTNNRIIKLAALAEADAIMLHGFIGVDAIESAQKVDTRIKYFIVTQLTNPGGLDFTAQFTEEFANIARHTGCAGVQAPGNRQDVVRCVRNIVGPDLMIICCGIGVQGGQFGHAIAAGADFEIIGRSIYKAEDPLETVIEIRNAIAAKKRQLAQSDS